MPALAAAVIILLPAAMPIVAADAQVDILATGQSTSVTFYGIGWKRDGSQAVIVGDGGALLTYSHSSGKFWRVDDPRLPAFLFGAAWRPDGLYALVVGADGAVFNFNGEALTPYCASRANYFRAVDWKSDGSEALIVGSGGIILRFRDGTFQPVDSGTSADLFSCSWNPKTQTALISGANSTLLRLETNGTVTKIPLAGDWSIYGVSWDPNGDRALLAGANGIIDIYENGQLTTVNNGTLNNFLGCCWRPGTKEGYVCGDVGVILEYADGKLSWVVSGPGLQTQLYGIRFRPQGDYGLAVGYFAKVARYPKAPRPAGVCLLDNPLVIAGIICIGIAVVIAYIAKDRMDRREGPKGPEGSRRRQIKEHRAK